MSDTVQTNVANHILTIRLNRPAKKNAFTEAMYTAAGKALLAAASDTDIHAVLICAEGDFSAGNDLADFLQHPPSGDDAPVLQFMQAFSQCPVPIVAAVSGVAIGIGSTMLLHCDFVYAANDTVFALPFIQLSLLPEFASSMLLPQRAGYLGAAELLLLGDKFDANTAQRAGIISHLCEPDALHRTAGATCQRLAQTPRAVLMQTKALLRRAPEPVSERIRHEGELFIEALQSADAKAAFQAILHK